MWRPPRERERGSFSREEGGFAGLGGVIASVSGHLPGARGGMGDERGRERGGDAAQLKTPRPECEESRPLSVEVRVLARGSLARLLRPRRGQHPQLREEVGREVPNENSA